jgi:hypothetical protein
MSERDAWQKKPSGQPGRVLRHDEWEALIADALDETLGADDAAAFNRHHSECALCAQMLKETRQGLAWTEHLRDEPEMPAGLLNKILARTSEPREPGFAAPQLVVPARAAWYRRALPVARQIFEPRLMMTAAMAFFSIALTLNLTGIRLTELRAADLRPSRVRASLTRQYYSTNEQVMKYYENLRLVYEMEARVRELRRSTEAEPVQLPRQTPKQPPPARDGTSPSSTGPKGGSPAPRRGGARLNGDAALPAMMVHAAPQCLYLLPAGIEPPAAAPARFDRAGTRGKVQREVFRALLSPTEDQAERSLV